MGNSMCIRGYSGLYDVTPDWHPIIGSHPEAQGFISCVGFSGHGFKLGPVVGEAVSELILEGKSRDVDLDLFAPDRFAGFERDRIGRENQRRAGQAVN